MAYSYIISLQDLRFEATRNSIIFKLFAYARNLFEEVYEELIESEYAKSERLESQDVYISRAKQLLSSYAHYSD